MSVDDHIAPESGSITPLPEDVQAFALLGAPFKMGLDESALEANYYALSRRMHPDFFQKAGPEALEASMERSATVNKAYRALRTLPGRAEYLLELFRPAHEAAGKKEAPKSLLMTVFELQEAIEELGGLPAGAPAESIAAARAKLRGLEDELSDMRRMQTSALGNIARDWDAVEPPPAETAREVYAPLLDRIEAWSHERSYLNRLFSNIARALGEED